MYIDDVFFNTNYLFRVVHPEGQPEYLTALILFYLILHYVSETSFYLSIPTHHYNAHAVLYITTIWATMTVQFCQHLT